MKNSRAADSFDYGTGSRAKAYSGCVKILFLAQSKIQKSLATLIQEAGKGDAFNPLRLNQRRGAPFHVKLELILAYHRESQTSCGIGAIPG